VIIRDAMLSLTAPAPRKLFLDIYHRNVELAAITVAKLSRCWCGGVEVPVGHLVTASEPSLPPRS
jgi:hypothetical protein